jgi:ribosomal protein S18 acetylase RimI-like enzyme
MIRRDMAEVLAITQETGGGWTEDDFLRCLRQTNTIGMVVELQEKVCCFFIYTLHSTHIELVELSVAKKYQRRGFGRKALDKLVSKLSSHKRTTLTAYVPEKNLGMQLFLRACGLRAVRVARCYYASSNDAAYVFEYNVDTETTAPANVVWDKDENDQ